MPYVHVYALPRDPDMKARTMARMTEVMVEEMKIPADAIHFLWHDTPAENIAKAGVTIAEKNRQK